MNRPLKFRVWDHILSEWIKSDQLVLRPNGSITDGSILIDSKYIQFNTSLNDKNGKEIYEGDIIKEHHFEDWGNDTVGYEYRGVVRYMTRHNYGFNDELKFSGFVTFPNSEENQKYIGNPLQTNCEIIGNIFEDSELLK